MAAWLIIERYDNWQVDAANNFSFFGLPQRYHRLAALIQKGDRVFCYVSQGPSAFSDIRQVEETGIRRLKVQSYDSAFAFYFSTSPVFVLKRELWIPIKDIAGQLELTKDRRDYRPLLQTSIRRLSTNDAQTLEKELKKRA